MRPARQMVRQAVNRQRAFVGNYGDRSGSQPGHIQIFKGLVGKLGQPVQAVGDVQKPPGASLVSDERPAEPGRLSLGGCEVAGLGFGQFVELLMIGELRLWHAFVCR